MVKAVLISLALTASCARDLGLGDVVYECSLERPCVEGWICDPDTRQCALPTVCGNGVVERREDCDELGLGCDRCALAPIDPPMIVRGLHLLQAVAVARSGAIVVAGTEITPGTSTAHEVRSALLIVLSPDGSELAREKLSCEGRNQGYVYALAPDPATGDVIATGHVYGDTDATYDENGVQHVTQMSRVIARIDDRARVRSCRAYPPEPPEATGRAITSVPGAWIIAGNTTRWGYDPEAEDGWIERASSTLERTAAAPSSPGFRAASAVVDGRGTLFVGGRRGPWLTSEAVVASGDPQLGDLLEHALPGIGSFSAAAPRRVGAWLFGSDDVGGPGFVVSSSVTGLGDRIRLDLPPAPNTEINGALAIGGDRTAIVGRLSEGGGLVSAGFLAFVGSEGELLRTIVIDTPKRDWLTAIAAESPSTLIVAGTRDSVATVLRWRY